MKRDATSKLIKISVGLKQNSFNFPKKLEVLSSINSEGMCGLIMLSKYFARWYSAVFIIETTGLNGSPGLWDLHNSVRHAS